MCGKQLTTIEIEELFKELHSLRAENERLKALPAKSSDTVQHASFEQALQQSEERFKTQFKHMPIPTYTWQWNGADLVLIDFNAAAEAITQGGVRNFIGSLCREMYRDRQDIVDDIHACFNSRQNIRREMLHQMRSAPTIIKHLVVTYVFVPPDLVMVHTEDVTERKLAEAALRESEARYRTLFENSPIGLGVADEHGTLLAFNDAMMRPGGYTREDILKIGNVAALYAFPEERDRALGLARKQGYLRQHEVTFKRKDGSHYIALLSLQPISLNGQRGWQAMAEDITERKQAEAALKESEVRLRMALEAGAMGFWDWDIPKQRITWTEQHERLFGFKPGEFDGRFETFINLVHPDDREIVGAASSQARDSHRPIQCDFRIIRPDGTVRWMNSHGQFSYDAKGQPTRMSGLVTDITDRKLSEQQLRKSEASLREAQRIASLGHWEWDVKTGIATWSDELFRITGKPKDGKPIAFEDYLAYVHPDDREQTRRAVEDALNGKAGYNVEKRLVRPNSEIRVVQVQAKVTRDGSGAPIRMSGTLQDITERKQLEAHLLQAQKIESVGRLAGGVAHDFNNLLTGIVGFTELLALKVPGPCEELDGIRQMAQRATSLTRQLLEFARKQTIEAKVVGLNTLIVRTSQMLNRLIGEHIELVTVPSPRFHHVKIDPGQFEQILMNLAVNARDAMPNGGTLTIKMDGVTLDESAARRWGGVPPGDYVSVAVSDSGVGMSEEIQAHLFEPFFTTKEFGKGTGLGLATCYGIIKQHGGHIWAESQPGRGSTFKLILPRAQAVDETPEKTERLDVSTGNELLLLAEDEPSVRAIAATTLRSAGYTVIEAVDGKDAMRLADAADKSFDLLVTDVVMPRMGGRELAAALRNRWKSLSVLLISGYTNDHEHALDRMADERMAFLSKPFTPDMLVRKVREVLDAHSLSKKP